MQEMANHKTLDGAVMEHPDPFKNDDVMDHAVQLAIRVLQQSNRLPAGRFRKRLIRDAVNELSSALELSILEARKAAQKKALEGTNAQRRAARTSTRAAEPSSRRRRRVSYTINETGNGNMNGGSRGASRARTSTECYGSSSNDIDSVGRVMKGQLPSNPSPSYLRRSRRAAARWPLSNPHASHALNIESNEDNSSSDAEDGYRGGLNRDSAPKRRSSRIACAAAAAANAEVYGENEMFTEQQAQSDIIEVPGENPEESDESEWSDTVELVLPVVRPRPFVEENALISDWASKTPILSTDDELTDAEADEIRRIERYKNILTKRFEERMHKKDEARKARLEALENGEDEDELMEISEPESVSDKDDTDWVPEEQYMVPPPPAPLAAQHPVSMHPQNPHTMNPLLPSAQQVQPHMAASKHSHLLALRASASSRNWNQEAMNRMLASQQSSYPANQHAGETSYPHNVSSTALNPRLGQLHSYVANPNSPASLAQSGWLSGRQQNVGQGHSHARYIVPANPAPSSGIYSQALTNTLTQAASLPQYQGTLNANERRAVLEVARMRAHERARAQAQLRLQMQMQSRPANFPQQYTQLPSRASAGAWAPFSFPQPASHTQGSAQVRGQQLADAIAQLTEAQKLYPSPAMAQSAIRQSPSPQASARNAFGRQNAAAYQSQNTYNSTAAANNFTASRLNAMQNSRNFTHQNAMYNNSSPNLSQYNMQSINMGSPANSSNHQAQAVLHAQLLTASQPSIYQSAQPVAQGEPRGRPRQMRAMNNTSMSTVPQFQLDPNSLPVNSISHLPNGANSGLPVLNNMAVPPVAQTHLDMPTQPPVSIRTVGTTPVMNRTDPNLYSTNGVSVVRPAERRSMTIHSGSRAAPTPISNNVSNDLGLGHEDASAHATTDGLLGEDHSQMQSHTHSLVHAESIRKASRGTVDLSQQESNLRQHNSSMFNARLNSNAALSAAQAPSINRPVHPISSGAGIGGATNTQSHMPGASSDRHVAWNNVNAANARVQPERSNNWHRPAVVHSSPQSAQVCVKGHANPQGIGAVGAYSYERSGIDLVFRRANHEVTENRSERSSPANAAKDWAVSVSGEQLPTNEVSIPAAHIMKKCDIEAPSEANGSKQIAENGTITSNKVVGVTQTHPSPSTANAPKGIRRFVGLSSLNREKEPQCSSIANLKSLAKNVAPRDQISEVQYSSSVERSDKD